MSQGIREDREPLLCQQGILPGGWTLDQGGSAS